LNYNNRPILILDLFCHISQHGHKISPVSKTNSHVFDVMQNNFWCTDWRPDCCILYTHFIFRESHERTASSAEHKFLLIQKLSLGQLPPSAIRRLIQLWSYSIITSRFFINFLIPPLVTSCHTLHYQNNVTLISTPPPKKKCQHYWQLTFTEQWLNCTTLLCCSW